MVNFNISKTLETIVEGYGKRLLERKYDELANLEFFQKLEQKGEPAKYAMELGLYVMTALFQQNFGEDSSWKRIFKEIASDSGAEISKRLINGEKYMSQVRSFAEKTLIQVVLELNLEERRNFINWMINSSPEEKALALKGMRGLVSGEISKILEHTAEERQSLFAIFEETPKPKREILPLTRGVIEKRLDDYIARKRKEKDDG